MGGGRALELAEHVVVGREALGPGVFDTHVVGARLLGGPPHKVAVRAGVQPRLPGASGGGGRAWFGTMRKPAQPRDGRIAASTGEAGCVPVSLLRPLC